MAFTLGGVTLPDGIHVSERYEVPLADQYRTGQQQTLITNQLSASIKYGWRLRFRMVTEAERDTLRTRYTTKGSQAWVPDSVTGTPFTVQVLTDTWDHEPVTIAGGNYRYNVGFTIEEE